MYADELINNPSARPRGFVFKKEVICECVFGSDGENRDRNVESGGFGSEKNVSLTLCSSAHCLNSEWILMFIHV